MSHARGKSVINNSPSKAQYAFPKASRFTSPKQNTAAFGYEIKGYFGNLNSSMNGRAFGTTENRFGYEDLRKKKRDMGKIDGPSDTNVERVKNKTYSYSFGVSRETMKKIHVDEILKKREENIPGPDRYEKKDLFGGTQGTNYSVRKKLGHFEMHLDKEKKLPGPGYYQANDLTGTSLSSSVLRSAQQSAFPKSTDRFRMPKMQSPPPTKYQVKNSLNENFNSQHNFMGAARIGTNKRNYIDEQWALTTSKIAPGPGYYTTFSDFSGHV